jgi:hypothetical protein
LPESNINKLYHAPFDCTRTVGRLEEKRSGLLHENDSSE